MRYLTALLITLNFLFAHTWVCPGDAVAPTIYAFSQLDPYTPGAYGFEDSPDDLPLLYGEIDTVNDYMTYWDDSSPVCGGSSNENTLIEAYCYPDDEDSICWKVLLGGGGTPLLTGGGGGGYTNAVTVVDRHPCLPRGVGSIGFGAYNWDNNTDLGFAGAFLNRIANETSEVVSDDVAEVQRAVCGSTSGTDSATVYIDYTEHLNQLIDNTSAISDINDREQQRETNLNSFASSKDIDSMMSIDDDLDTFNTTFETTISDTYSTYSDIFGFGDYGSAPDPISFTMFGDQYKVFDPDLLTPYIGTIRTTFAIFAYLWGFIVVFRSI